MINEKIELEKPFNPQKNAFNVSNGVVILDLNTGEHHIVEHSHTYKFDYKLQVAYDQDADVGEILLYIESLGIEIKDILIQIPAHCMLSMNGYIYKKAYFLKGEKDCGKTTYMEMLAKKFFGESMCCSLSLHELLYDRFKPYNLKGKIMSYYGDLPDTKLKDIGKFRMLTGGDGMNIEAKGVQSEDNFVNRAVLMFGSNNYPKIDVPNDSGAFWGRWIPAPFGNRFIVDPSFVSRTFTDANMSALLNLVLMMIPSIIQDGLRTNGDIMTEWLRDSDTSYEFIQNSLSKCIGAVVIKNTCYANYVDYCNENDLSISDIKVFSRAMRSCGYNIESTHTINGKREHCYSDCKLNSSDFALYPDGFKDPIKIDIAKSQTTL